jgi:hypothetical protein
MCVFVSFQSLSSAVDMLNSLKPGAEPKHIPGLLHTMYPFLVFPSHHVPIAQCFPFHQETGRLGIAACAMQDGSSYVCPLCGGCVNINRRLQHEQLWCQP